MKLDEAIKHAEEEAKEQDKLCKRYDDASGYTRSHNEDIRTTGAKKCEECAEEHRQIAEWLKELKQLREQTRWIPVSERMPNFNDIVLASTDSDYDELKVVLTVYGAEEFWFNGKIKAWIPLPEPYKA